MNGLKDWVEKQIKREYIRGLRSLLSTVAHTLATNPHNTFEGSAKQYIRRYDLHRVMYKRIKDYWDI